MAPRPPVTSRATMSSRPAGPTGLGTTAGLIAIFMGFPYDHPRGHRGGSSFWAPNPRLARRPSVRRRAGRHPIRSRPAHHPPALELVTPGARRGEEIGVAIDRRRHPVDVGRLERRDLAERMTVEL